MVAMPWARLIHITVLLIAINMLLAEVRSINFGGDITVTTFLYVESTFKLAHIFAKHRNILVVMHIKVLMHINVFMYSCIRMYLCANC